jgi:truncated hemoglobin YjbI
MQEWLHLFPLPLLVLTVVFIVVPTLLSIYARIALYRYLRAQIAKVSRLLNFHESRGLQPKILENLETRFKSASLELENVNTIALISSAYGEEKISLVGFKLQCDQAENFCRVLPNLLLAFGLLGTFIGITSNLYNIGEAINRVSQSGADIGALVQQLLPQLQGMGIAFLASLVSLFCSSLLTIINFSFNTGWAKYRLIGCLEDYLDNIYKPSVEGDTRLDKAVSRMVEQQQEFLTRFHEKVGQVLEDSFGRAANQIADECSKINKVAEQVYTHFSQAAGTIATGATTFQQSARSLETQTQAMAKLIPQFQSSAEQIHLGSLRFLSASEKIEQTNAIANLEKVTSNLCTTQEAFTSSTETLQIGLEGIMSSNLQAAQLAEQVYKQLKTSTSQIQQGSKNFLKAANLIQDSSLGEQLNTAAEKWGLAQGEFTSSTATFSQASQSLEPVVGAFYASSKTLEELGTQILHLSQASLKVTEANQQNIASREQQFLTTQQNFEQILQFLTQTVDQVESSLKQLHENWVTQSAEQLTAHKEQNGQLLQTMGHHISQISDNQRSLGELIKTTSETGSTLQKLGGIWNTSSTNQLNAQQQYHERIAEKMGQYISQIADNQRSLNALIGTTTDLKSAFSSNITDLSGRFSRNIEKLTEQLSVLIHHQTRPPAITSSALEPTVARTLEENY